VYADPKKGHGVFIVDLVDALSLELQYNSWL